MPKKEDDEHCGCGCSSIPPEEQGIWCVFCGHVYRAGCDQQKEEAEHMAKCEKYQEYLMELKIERLLNKAEADCAAARERNLRKVEKHSEKAMAAHRRILGAGPNGGVVLH